ncbi:MAG: zinc-ribbon domain-containing protein [Bacillota bacterium]|uniref:DUF2116 family Zn-ribbon domain-containing protein n=1 Tax=Virgibacillus salarius TaxID=447199 RepID=A0A941DVV9_9BACI|nr:MULTISPECIES: DUF2116 family Zn-ribbon domain-containing protein [Bacillaceae]MBR7796447.1 DUF2116 family Zn-ribbon domain-containing protein [Virgibacillus salarius]NAZ09156.1 DUF2116 family Zn-ribbon domain-containing protein [Agaribacter marinus]
MLHCPYCGTSIKEDESYCIKCGKKLPEDRFNRVKKKVGKQFWKLPAIVTGCVLLSIVLLYVTLEIRTAKAKDLYNKGEEKVLNAEYQEAKELFQKAIDYKHNFNQAQHSLEFMDHALSIRASLEESTQFLKEKKYQAALDLINNTENTLKDFDGPAINQLIDEIAANRNAVKLKQVTESLKKEPNIDQLKILLWDAASIDTEEAEPITKDIRDQIINYTYTRANEQLNKKQFNDAKLIVEDGLKYAPKSEKLTSLQTTIDKEQVSFETAQQKRIEQAMTSATKEQQVNENDAVELVSIKTTSDDQGNLVVKGKVKSVATIPVNSIMVKYRLQTKDGHELLTNGVYVYPDELYPDESGNFEFTHFDIDYKAKDVETDVEKITWYTD